MTGIGSTSKSALDTLLVLNADAAIYACLTKLLFELGIVPRAVIGCLILRLVVLVPLRIFV